MKKAWQKAKPITLTKTGVSELLRTLPDDPDQSQLKIYKKVANELGGKIADPKIKAEKKALACLVKIKKDIEDDLAFTKNNRAKGVRIMQALGKVGEDYLAGAKKLEVTPNFDALASGLRKEMDIVTSRGYDKVSVPNEFMIEYRALLDAMGSRSKRMIELLEDKKKPKPQFDLKKDFPIELNKFKASMDKLPGVWGKVAKLDP